MTDYELIVSYGENNIVKHELVNISLIQYAPEGFVTFYKNFSIKGFDIFPEKEEEKMVFQINRDFLVSVRRKLKN